MLVTGDLNEHAKAFRRIACPTDMDAAVGGETKGSTCRLPKAMRVDWIFGAKGTFANTEVNQGARTRVTGRGPVPLHESVSVLGSLKHRSLEEVSEARGAVEVQVMRLAARRITPAQLDRLQDLVDEQQDMLADPVRFQISDQEFHNTLYSACGNQLLADVVSDFYGYALEFRRLALQRKGAIGRSVEDHASIVAALRAGRPEAAAEAMQLHLDQVESTTRAVMPG